MSSQFTDPVAMEEAAKALLGKNLGINMGSYILGLWLDAVLFGVMIQQIINWSTYTVKERWMIKAIVYWTTLFSTIFTVFQIVMNMHFFAYGFGKFLPFESVDWIGWPPLLDSVISSSVQIFYIERAYRLNGNNKFLLVSLVSLVLVSFAAALGVRIKFGLLAKESDAAQINIFVYTWLSTCLAADILITTFVAWGLHKSRTGWSTTDRLVARLILLSCETQLAPTLITVGFIVEFSIIPPSSLGVFFECFQSKVYVIAFLAVLNSRYNLRRDIKNEAEGHGSRAGKNNTYTLGNSRHQQATVNVTTETYVESFQMQPDKLGRNRDPAFDVKDTIDEGSETVDLDYGENHSKVGLTDPSQRV